MRSRKDLSDANRSTQQFVDSWLAMKSHLRQTEDRLVTDKQNLKEVEQALGAHLAPSDMDHDEELGIWVRIDEKREGLALVKCFKHREEGRLYSIVLRSTKRADEVNTDEAVDENADG